MSSDLVYEFQTDSSILTERTLNFNTPEERKIFNDLKPIQVVNQNERTLFFFGSKTDQKTMIDMKGNNLNAEAAKKKECECLTIVKFSLDKTGQLLKELGVDKPKTNTGSNSVPVDVTIFPIDHVFDTGIFMKSKVFVLED